MMDVTCNNCLHKEPRHISNSDIKPFSDARYVCMIIGCLIPEYHIKERLCMCENLYWERR